MLVCAMFIGMASTSCDKDPVKPDTENPDNGGNNGGNNGAQTLVVKYTGNEKMNGQFVNVGKWSATVNDPANYTAPDNGFGKFDANNEAEYDASLLASLKEGDKIWVCIEDVVKYFHTVTAAELEAGVLNLPDKDGGNTMRPEPTLNGKPYENDWVVTLYMGQKGLYWATGNLIAVKTGAAGAPSAPAFYFATLEETAQEALGGNTGNPYNAASEAASQETISKTDGFQDVPQGYRWDCFLPLDGTGTRTDVYDNDGNFFTFNMITKIRSELGEKNWAWGGYDGYDLATTQLKGSWTIPSRWDPQRPTGGAGFTQAEVIGSGQLCDLIYKADRTSGEWSDENGGKYWRIVYQTKSFENTILLPGGAMRRPRSGKMTSDTGYRVVVMASGQSAGNDNTMCFDTYADNDYAAGYYYNAQSGKLFNIRPVTK